MVGLVEPGVGSLDPGYANQRRRNQLNSRFWFSVRVPPHGPRFQVSPPAALGALVELY